MSIIRLVMAAAVMLSAVGAHAQDASSPVPRGNYALMADSGYAGPDLTGFIATFADDNSMTVVSPDGSLVVKSKLVFDAGTVSLNDVDGSNACPVTGKYKVTGSLAVFKLTLVEDGCAERAAIVVGLKWVKLEK